MEGAVATAATEPTAATVVTVVAERALGSAPSVLVGAVEEETFALPTRKRKPTEDARLSSNQVVNPATKPKVELAYSAVYWTHETQAKTLNLSKIHSADLSADVARE